jgi:hypothetical protein
METNCGEKELEMMALVNWSKSALTLPYLRVIVSDRESDQRVILILTCWHQSLSAQDKEMKLQARIWSRSWRPRSLASKSACGNSRKASGRIPSTQVEVN